MTRIPFNDKTGVTVKGRRGRVKHVGLDVRPAKAQVELQGVLRDGSPAAGFLAVPWEKVPTLIELLRIAYDRHNEHGDPAEEERQEAG